MKSKEFVPFWTSWEINSLFGMENDDNANCERSTLEFPIRELEEEYQTKKIHPFVLPHFYGLKIEDPNTFLSKFNMLCKSYDYMVVAL